MVCFLLKSISKVFLRSGTRFVNMTSSCGRWISYCVTQLRSKKGKNKSTRKTNSKESQDDSTAVDIPQPVLEEEGVIEDEGVIVDEGYQSALDCTTCKKSLVKMEESYTQQIRALELKLISQQNRIDKYYHIKNELTNNEENFFEGKGKGGKGYVRKACNLKQLTLKEQYLSKIKSDEKRRFRFLQLDHGVQLMICKIDALRGSGSDDHFIDELLETFEGMSMQLQRLKKTVEEMKELEGIYVKAIDELMHHHQKTIEEKDQEIDYLRKNVKVVLVGKEMSGYGYLGESSINKNGKKSKKYLKTDRSDESQITIANMEALRELDNMVYNNVAKMLGWQK